MQKKRRISKNTRPYIEKAYDSALLAIEVYNKPAITFRSAAYIALMIMAWTSLFHAIFLRKKVRPYYKNAHGRFETVDGDYKHWELKECARQYWGTDVGNPVRKNLEFFIPLRNKIEHRYMPPLDAEIFGECQALLLNFDALISTEFGMNYRLRESLSFALQLFPSGRSLAQTSKKNAHAREIKNFIDSYRSMVTTEAMNSGQFAFKAFLIQVANHQSQDSLSIEFVQYDKLTKQQQLEIDKIFALVKLKKVQVLNSDCLKPSAVVTAVQSALGNPMVQRGGKTVPKFSADTHTRCWRKYQVRPQARAEKPELTDRRYCLYDAAHRDYLYTNEWVEFLVEKIKDENEYRLLYSPN